MLATGATAAVSREAWARAAPRPESIVFGSADPGPLRRTRCGRAGWPYFLSVKRGFASVRHPEFLSLSATERG